MNLVKFKDEMLKRISVLESENLFLANGKQHESVFSVAAVWDDGYRYQVVIMVRAGDFVGFAGYSERVEPAERSRFSNEEEALSIRIRGSSMWGDGLLSKLRSCPPGQILWRYPEAGDLTPTTLSELMTQTASIPRWLDTSVFG